MTLLVTGAGGFVMSNLVKRWLEVHPTEDVLALDSEALDPLAEAFFAPYRSRLTFVELDVRDWTGLRSLAASYDFSHMVHGATVTSIRRMATANAANPGMAGIRPALEANIMGTVNLLALASCLPALKRLIYVSSGAVYAGTASVVPLPEEGFVSPSDFYAISKYAGELLAERAVEQCDIPAICVRLSGVYGPMDRQTASRDVECAPLRVARAALARQTVRLNARDAVGDFIHVEDVAEALTLLLQADELADVVYNIAYGETVSLEQLVNYAAERLGDVAIDVVPASEADVVLDPESKSGRWGAYDISRITKAVGWRPRPLRQAFLAYMDWLSSKAAI